MNENGHKFGALKKCAVALLILPALLLAGCGGPPPPPPAPVWEWIKPGATDDDFTVDNHICEAESIEKTPVIEGVQDTVAKRQLKKGCLYKKGWRLYKDGVLQ